jgi:hypothetical protein
MKILPIIKSALSFLVQKFKAKPEPKEEEIPQIIADIKQMVKNTEIDNIKEPLIFLFNFVYFFIFQKKFL